ncbi:protein TOPLESS-RELATED PROTEIN 2-like [Coffea arabica]|uniref:Protein TOPLESS-RELATED PROTEIN 2-like n=1 Tax=Coffea arabica TaxID=13443 RepID=A0ABM4VBX6_COFAR
MRLVKAVNLKLFSCGTSKEGESHLVEWNEREGAVKKTYSGFRKRSLGVVQFDRRNRFLAADDEFQIKFWDMDNNHAITFTDADGGLPGSPSPRFNKEGSLLAVTTRENGIKILVNTDGQYLLRMLESRTFEESRAFSEQPAIDGSLGPIGHVAAPVASILERTDRIQQSLSIGNLAAMDGSTIADVKPRISDNADRIKCWKFSDIAEANQLKTPRLPDPLAASKILRLLYTNSGLALLVLGSNALHRLWKWQRSERNPSGKSIASIIPQMWLRLNN